MARLGPLVIVLSLFLSVTARFATAQVPSDPVYIRASDGWKGLYGIGDEYAEYSFKGSDVKLEDAYHVLLTPSLGAMVTFTGRNQIGPGIDVLNEHLQWELDYWRKHASKVESVPRNDLSGG